MTLEPFTVYLPPVLWRILDGYAAARGIPTRSLLIEELARQLTKPPAAA